ncbi:hypothetical protein [Fodinicola feengrottensis]|uniref:hypothetical protein n=1 Tax=Fodinicola feengrottensis TaxID=435914 RepID=UPI002443009B|nr:hypothetical protein [Fodinicola feengrottensis]
MDVKPLESTLADAGRHYFAYGKSFRAISLQRRSLANWLTSERSTSYDVCSSGVDGGHVVRDRAQSAQVVQFWRAIEMFSPPGVPKCTPAGPSADAKELILDVPQDGLAPWQPAHPITSRPPSDGMTWQFTVYGGLYEVSSARTELVKAFGEDAASDEAPRDGRTAMFAFTLDAHGSLVRDSATLSACAWAVHRLRAVGPHNPRWLDGFFDGEERDFVEGLNRLAPTEISDGN